MKTGIAAKKPGGIAKCPTGIRGLDAITKGGLPSERPTLVCGGPGCGKTLLAAEFLVRGARDFGEPGVFLAFEETGAELAVNMSSLGFPLAELQRKKKLAVDFIRIERSEIEETGEYDLEGLFIRLDSLVRSVGAKRVAIDSLEALFAGLPNEAILRAELRRLFRWLKERKLTAVITAEQGRGELTRHGLEEYVSDCVIFLDNRVVNQTATRRLRVLKYRGSAHGGDEYPYIIDSGGFSVLPITSLGLDHRASSRKNSSGLPALDRMLGGGCYVGSSLLVSGTTGSGKSSIAATFAAAACGRGERCLYFSFEESPAQIKRNMASIGLPLERWEKKGLLKFNSARPCLMGMEAHLVAMHALVDSFGPGTVIVDPVSNMTEIGDAAQARAMLTRLIDYLKSRGVTAVFTSLTGSGGSGESGSGAGVSSLMDAWILLRMTEAGGERRRQLYVLKNRGLANSGRVAEFSLTDAGVRLAADGEKA